MKRTTVVTVCVSLLFGGLLCLHLAAQPDKAEVKVPVLLFDPKIKDSGEKELLEMKVDCYRQIATGVDNLAAVGSLRGIASQVAEAKANLAGAEIELYHFTGDKEKLLAAMDAKIEALTNKFKALDSSFEHTTITLDELLGAKIQLLDALLERKRMEK
jgi:hypothetical protein